MSTGLFALALTIGFLPQSTLPPDSPPPAAKLSYDEAYARAVATNKPLVCWVGGGDVICPACVQTLKDEAVHYFADSIPGMPPKCIVVGMPDGGDLIRVAVITDWIVGDPVWGHVESTRRAVKNWNATKFTTQSGWSLDPLPPTPAMSQPIQMGNYRPVMRRSG